MRERKARQAASTAREAISVIHVEQPVRTRKPNRGKRKIKAKEESEKSDVAQGDFELARQENSEKDIVPKTRGRKPSNQTTNKRVSKDVDDKNQSVKRKRSSTENEPEPTRRRPLSPPLTDTSIERPRNVDRVIYGRAEIGAWYYAPYPSEFGALIDRLYICERCLQYTNLEKQYLAHRMQCQRRRPPGKVIYKENKIKVYEVDGRDDKLYCQNLCLFTKLFLDHKTLYYDVEGFKFYVLTETSGRLRTDIMAGYFSKEKISYDNYNLACIMTLPTHQRKGYGRLLIELSYELSRREGVIGSPEKPLSNLGLLGYQSFWASTLLSALHPLKSNVTIEELCWQTGIHEEDVISTLKRLDLLDYWKPPSGDSEIPLEICITHQMMNQAMTKFNIKLGRRLNPALLQLQ
ncbi:acyl-CoA N-acyltransferase [Radiomyces spectabilis]|uniref:acyl-CoA N-acyltransferase n=1 Tax=Radiomyces spectabilis TaxID=64574 RepID=UPI00221EA315|nr:acyl-CoA N-acyltransferase [Radiomyces spectabilis]KAI8374329.1 acyl-CoA N-acyltransferase [Radiomyces spectabilis]